MNQLDKKYQVFISSTYEDLKEHRRALIGACLESGYIPVGMEMFSAGDDDQLTVIHRTIEQCDYYVVIIAHRYGSTRTLPDGRQLSYTEIEYDYAVEKHVPVIALLADADVAVPASKIESDEQRRLLEAFKAKAKQRMCKFWKSPEDLALKATAAIVKATQDQPRPGWIRGTNAASPQTAEELARLSKENEELRSRLSNIDPDESEVRRCQVDWDGLGKIDPMGGLSGQFGVSLDTRGVFLMLCEVPLIPISRHELIQVLTSHVCDFVRRSAAGKEILGTEVSPMIRQCIDIYDCMNLIETVADRRRSGPIAFDVHEVQLTDRGHALRRWIRRSEILGEISAIPR